MLPHVEDKELFDTTIDLEVRKMELVRRPLVATRIDDQGVRRPQLHLQGLPAHNCILGVVEPDPLELLCMAAMVHGSGVVR